MPVFIAHRGNISGINPDLENTIDYLRQAHNEGFGVECDLQVHKGALYLGHDEPQEQADYSFLTKPYVFCHAKTVDTMQILINSGLHCFWHENDKMTLTSLGFMWCYPGIYPEHHKAIWLDIPEHNGGNLLPKDVASKDIFGVCGDNYFNIKWETY